MAGWDSGVSPPGGANYTAPLLKFDQFSNWAADDPYQKIFNQQRQNLTNQTLMQGQRREQLAQALQGGAALDSHGVFDPQKAAAILAKFGDIDAIEALTPLIQQQQAGNTPMWPGGQGGGQPGPPMQQPTSLPARPLPPTPANATVGDAGKGTIASLVTDRLPNQDATTGQTIAKIAQTMGVDPNANLTPGQVRRAQGLLQRYAPDDSPASFKKRFAQAGDDGGSLPPSANAVSPAPKVTQAPAPAGGPPGGQGGPPMPPQPQAGQQPPQQAGAPGQPMPQGPGGQTGAQPQGAGPIVPQVPLPPGFNNPQQAAMALRQRAAQIETANPKTKPKADELRDWAARIEASIAPVKMGQYDTYVNPADPSKIVAQGPAAAAMSAAGGETGATLDADANQYRLTGKLPPNMGRGIQGQQQATAIRTRAAEQEVNAGGDPAEWPAKWQKFGAQATGRRALENRAAGLELAENEATTLIPRVREASARVSRTQYPDINSLINAAHMKTGGTDVIKLGIAIESLVPVYARVLKPTGQIAQGDMARAHDILNRSWSDGQIGAALDQMGVELKSARSALDKTLDEYGGPSSKTKTDASQSATSTAKWVTMPNGVRIREISQ